MTRIKICGITNYADARFAAESGADYVGFIFADSSPRKVLPEIVTHVTQQLRSEFPKMHFVGVFVNENVEEIKKIIAECGLDTVQLHGEESIAVCDELRPYVEVWKSIVVKTKADVELGYSYHGHADKILFDAGSGSGKTFNHNLLSGKIVDIIAGGIGSNNIREIIQKLNPKIVDVNSKVEISPGIKNPDLIEKLFSAIKN